MTVTMESGRPAKVGGESPHGPAGPMGGVTAPSGLTATATSGTLQAAGLTFEIPEGWQKVPPANQMRLAQYRLAGEAGAADLVVSAFGVGQGGDPKANVDRWLGQFKQEGETSATTPADVATLESGGLKIFLVKTSGTFDAGSMAPMMPASEPKPNQALFGMVIEGGTQGTVFVKATGPKATIEAQNAKLEKFAKSVRRIE